MLHIFNFFIIFMGGSSHRFWGGTMSSTEPNWIRPSGVVAATSGAVSSRHLRTKELSLMEKVISGCTCWKKTDIIILRTCKPGQWLLIFRKILKDSGHSGNMKNLSLCINSDITKYAAEWLKTPVGMPRSGSRLPASAVTPILNTAGLKLISWKITACIRRIK